MPCPFFIPDQPVGELNPGASPLGDLFGGRCGADLQFEIPPELLRTGCNYGYARDKCALAATADSDSTCLVIAKIGAGMVHVRWSLERDHHPVAVGELVTPTAKSTPLEAQAEAYVSVYRRRV